MRTLALQQLESALNAYLRLDPDTINQLASLQNKVILLDIEDWNFNVFITPTPNGLSLHPTLDCDPDTIICGKLEALIKLSQTDARNSDLFKNRVVVTGDLETGEKIRDILNAIDIDWEEKLSQFTGDIIAHKIGSFARKLKQTGQQTRATLSRNLSEFLRHEVNLLPSRQEVTCFTHEVSNLRNDVDRLEARLCLLLQKGKTNS